MKAPCLYRLPLFGLTALVALYALATPCEAAAARASGKPAPAPAVVEPAPVEVKKPGFFARIIDKSADAVSRSAKAMTFWRSDSDGEAASPTSASVPTPKSGRSQEKAGSPVVKAPKPDKKSAPVTKSRVAKAKPQIEPAPTPKLAGRTSANPVAALPSPAPEPKEKSGSGWGVFRKLAFWKGDRELDASPEPAVPAKSDPRTKLAPGKPAAASVAGIARKGAIQKIGPEKPATLAQSKSKTKATAASKSEPAPVLATQPEKKRGFFASLFSFGGSDDKPTAAPARPTKVDPALARVEASRAAAMAKLTPDRFVVTKDETAFYAYGPGQIPPVDAYLNTGTLITLVKKSWGWAEVRLPDGRTGMIDRSAIRQASIYDLAPDRPAGPSRAMLAQMQRNGSRASQPVVEILPALPMPELPGPEVRPSAETLSASLLPPLEQ